MSRVRTISPSHTQRPSERAGLGRHRLWRGAAGVNWLVGANELSPVNQGLMGYPGRANPVRESEQVRLNVRHTSNTVRCRRKKEKSWWETAFKTGPTGSTGPTRRLPGGPLLGRRHGERQGEEEEQVLVWDER